MPIYDYDGSVATKIVKVYDYDGSVATVLKNGYDYDGSVSNTLFSAETSLWSNGNGGAVDGWTRGWMRLTATTYPPTFNAGEPITFIPYLRGTSSHGAFIIGNQTISVTAGQVMSADVSGFTVMTESTNTTSFHGKVTIGLTTTLYTEFPFGGITDTVVDGGYASAEAIYRAVPASGQSVKYAGGTISVTLPKTGSFYPIVLYTGYCASLRTNATVNNWKIE